jgi:proteasome activator subunit 4
MLSFLPLSHPQSYLPMLFRLWESINSYSYDERMLAFLSQLAEMHVDPSISDPQKIQTIPDDERSEHEGRPVWSRDESAKDSHWAGLYKDVGIFSEHEWSFLMCKCLASMGKCRCTFANRVIMNRLLVIPEIPLADSGSLTTGPSADTQMGFEIGRLPEAAWRIRASPKAPFNIQYLTCHIQHPWPVS